MVSTMSDHPRPELLQDALQLPAQDRLALATELINSVEGAEDTAWEAAWLSELDRRAGAIERDPSTLESWEIVRDRLLAELKTR